MEAKKSFSDFIKNVPKTEIHLHMEATCPAQTYLTLNERHGIDSSLDSVDSVKQLMTITSLPDMIKNFIHLQNFFCSEEDYSLMVEDIGNYAKENNIKYCEAHFSISLPKRKGLNVKTIITIIKEGLEQLYKQNGIDIYLIIDLSRTFGVDNAMENLQITTQIIAESGIHRIAGIGLGGSEKENDILEYLPVFAEAQKQGIHCVAHAGEVGNSNNISNAVFKLKAERIGHAISAKDDPDLVSKLKDLKTPIEINMTSNIITGHFITEYEKHPVKEFYHEGLKLCINSDDPFLFDTSLTNEFIILHEQSGFTIPEIITLLNNSINACFLSKEKKNELYTELMLYYAKWCGTTHL